MLTREDIEYATREFGPARWVSFGTTNESEGLFLLRVTPLPPPDELGAVIADICAEGIPVNVTNGRVRHSQNCRQTKHIIPESIVRKAMRNLKEVTYSVAIHPNISLGPVREKPLINGQPLAILYEPRLTYMEYPDHPHLNMGGPDRNLPGINFPLPDTLCYTSNPQELGEKQTERLLNAFGQVTIWLLRHQVWEATRTWQKRGKWIGPHEGSLGPIDFLQRLNPEGLCWCGKQQRYRDCHMSADLADVESIHGNELATTIKKRIAAGWWGMAVYEPQRKLSETLKRLQ